MARIAIKGATGYVGLAVACAAVTRGFEVYSVGARKTESNWRQRQILDRIGVKPFDVNRFAEKQPYRLLVIATTPYDGDVADVENLVATELFETVVYLGSGAQMLSPDELAAETQKVAATKNTPTPYSSYGLNKRRISLIPGVFTIHMGFLIPDVATPIINIGLQHATWSNLCESVALSQVKDPQRSYRITAVSTVIRRLVWTMQRDETLDMEPGPYGYPSLDIITPEPWTRHQIWRATFATGPASSIELKIRYATKLHKVVARIDKARSTIVRFLANDVTLSSEYLHGIAHLNSVFYNAFIAYFTWCLVIYRDGNGGYGSSGVVTCMAAMFHEYFDDKFVKPEDVPEREKGLRDFLERELHFSSRKARAISLVAQSVSYRKRAANSTPVQRSLGGFPDDTVETAWNTVNDADMLEAYDLKRTFAVVVKKNRESADDVSFDTLDRAKIRTIIAQRAADHIDEKLKHLHGLMWTEYGKARSEALHAELMEKYKVLREIQGGTGSLAELDETMEDFFGLDE
jgi:hypothetical protein